MEEIPPKKSASQLGLYLRLEAFTSSNVTDFLSNKLPRVYGIRRTWKRRLGSVFFSESLPKKMMENEMVKLSVFLTILDRGFSAYSKKIRYSISKDPP